MEKLEIVYAGASHYGLDAYISLQQYFNKIYLVSDCAEEIIANRRLCDEVIETFESVDVPYVFLGGYGGFIKREALERKTYINVHGALLPKYRGMHSTFWAIMNGEKELGISIHLVNEWMDAGDILGQFCFEYYGQTVEEVNKKIDSLVRENVGRVVSEFVNGRIIPTKQDDSKATYGAKRNLDDCYIDFTYTNLMLERLNKALTYPYPRPMLKIAGKRYEILDMQIVERDYFGPLGRAVYMDEQGVWIKVSQGFLVVKYVRDYETRIESELSSLIRIGYRFL